MNDHTKRINEIMQSKMMNATQFSEAIGIQRAAMSHITLGRNNPSADVLTKILERFTDINPSWLMTGNGTMKLSTDSHNDGLFDESYFKTTPLESEISMEEAGSQPDENGKIVEKEVVIYKERPSKTIDKLLIFYSDRTFETFLPEKSE